MTTDMNPIVDCPRRELYKTPNGTKILCNAIPIPAGLSFKELMVGQHLYQQRIVTASDCEKCLNEELPSLHNPILNYTSTIKPPRARKKKQSKDEIQRLLTTSKVNVEKDNSLIFEHDSDEWEPPKDIEGYERDPNNLWRFISSWAVCCHREVTGYQLHDCGCVHLDIMCRHPNVDTTNQRVKLQQCKQCLKRKTGEIK